MAAAWLPLAAALSKQVAVAAAALAKRAAMAVFSLVALAAFKAVALAGMIVTGLMQPQKTAAAAAAGETPFQGQLARMMAGAVFTVQAAAEMGKSAHLAALPFTAAMAAITRQMDKFRAAVAVAMAATAREANFAF